MIWGKTHKQAIYDVESKWPDGKNWYAWRPVWLNDGRWVWREWIWREYWSSWGEGGYSYYTSKKQLEQEQKAEKKKSEKVQKELEEKKRKNDETYRKSITLDSSNSKSIYWLL